MKSSVLLVSVFLMQVSIILTNEGDWDDYKYGPQTTELISSCSWKCLLFTLQWPPGFCQSLDNETGCRIPQSINNWTIHGLWPVRAKNCCTCWPMFHSDIQELEADLSEQWPSFVKGRSSFHFWRDEWRKHGVCAACAEGMNSPLRYFQTCLKLRGRVDILKLLEDGGITPSCEQPYKVAEVHSVLAPHLGDKFEIECVTDNKKREVWFQVKVPLSLNLTVSCDHRGDGDDPASSSRPRWSAYPRHPCPPHVPLYYLPINHQRPQQPCN